MAGRFPSELQERCEVSRFDRGITIRFAVSHNIKHRMQFSAENKQIKHFIETTDDPNWMPKLDDFKRLSRYFKMLYALARVTTYVDTAAIRRIRGKRKPSLLSALRAVYGTRIVKQRLTEFLN